MKKEQQIKSEFITFKLKNKYTKKGVQRFDPALKPHQTLS